MRGFFIPSLELAPGAKDIKAKPALPATGYFVAGPTPQADFDPLKL